MILSAQEFAQLTVVARGHQPRELELTLSLPRPTQPEIIEVILDPCTELRLELTSDSGLSLSLIQAWFSAESELYESPISAKLHEFSGIGLDGHIYYHGRQETRTGFRTSAEGNLDIIGLRPGQALRLELCDALGRHLHTQVVAALSRGERRVVPIHLSAPLGHRSCALQDSQGQLLVGASASIDAGGGLALLHTRTDELGRLDLPGVLHEPVAITAWKIGFERMRVDGLQPGGSDEPQVLTLRPGIDLRVALVDHSGRPQVKAEVSAVDPESGTRWVATRLRRGLWELIGLGDAPVEVRASAGELFVTSTCDASQTPTVSLQLPAPEGAELQGD